MNTGHSGRRDHRQGGGNAIEVAQDVHNVGGQESYRGEQLGELVLSVAKQFPDVQWELYRVTVLGDTVAVEVSIQGTSAVAAPVAERYAASVHD